MNVQFEPKITHSDDPVKEIWSMLNYFESEHNARRYLEEKFGSSTDLLLEAARNIALTMRAAREYYEAAEHVTVLTRPLLLFYGMTALSKVIFAATFAKKSPSTGHGLQPVDGWSRIFSEYSVKGLEDGTFPQFHGCFDKQSLGGIVFSAKELFSVIPDAKVAFETVYGEKSRALKISRSQNAVHITESELQLYENLEDQISKIPGIHERYMETYQRFKNAVTIFNRDHDAKDPTVRAISGEEYLVLPLLKQGSVIALPEMSAHFLIMYVLGMLSRYPLKEWGEIIQAEKSGEMYVIQRFLEITKRKFPNPCLNELHHRNFIFVGPTVGGEKEQLDREQLEEIYGYVSRRLADDVRGY